MTQRKIDNRIRDLIESGVETGHRNLFVIVGEKSMEQVVYLHHMLSKKIAKSRPTVLWCHKKEHSFAFQKKRMKSLEKKVKSGKLNVNEDDPLELFLVSTKIHYCCYKDSQKILGNTFGMCVLQDFEALTPNLLARTMETVEGGGIIVILLPSMPSLKQLFTMNMDVHKKLRTEAHQDVICRFNERFLLSLASCARSLVINDQFHVLPISKHNLKVQPALETNDTTEFKTDLKVPIDNSLGLKTLSLELETLKDNHRDTQPTSSLLECCKTLDQAKALLKLMETVSEKTLRSTVSLTAARGRGKSATMGLAIAGAIASGYSNIYVTSPNPENLSTLFNFVFKGLDALNYKENYTSVQSTNCEFNKAIVRVNVFKNHRQTIQFVQPSDAHKLQQVELLVIDEAAAIPLPLVKAMFGPYLIFLASTINGYEGTGRSLSLKLLQQLRTQSIQAEKLQGKNNFSMQRSFENSKDNLQREEEHSFQKKSKKTKKNSQENQKLGRVLEELTLEEPIRYKSGDQVEAWLSQLLCLDAGNLLPPLLASPTLESCQLLYINRETLFSFHKASEKFLQKLVSLYVASHYKNTPNDLQMMSDAPAHHLFCLVGPLSESKLPEVLVFIQICMEGQLSKESIESKMGRGQKAAGDLIPWTISQQFDDPSFPMLRGARIVRIATHPEYQGMGYGARALELLKEYYSTKSTNIAIHDSKKMKKESKLEKKRKREEDESDLLTEIIEPRAEVPPLFMTLSERPAEILDYIGVSFGVTEQLLKFWKKAKFVPVYLRQTTNDITGEHTCIMLHQLNNQDKNLNTQEKEFYKQKCCLQSYWTSFRQRFVHLLPLAFQEYKSSFALGILENKAIEVPAKTLSRDALEVYLDTGDLRQLNIYSKNMSDYHLIRHVIPSLAKMYFLKQFGTVNLPAGQKNSSLQISAVQATILLGLGLQNKSIEKLEEELNLQSSQLLGLFNKTVSKFSSYLHSLFEDTDNSII